MAPNSLQNIFETSFLAMRSDTSSPHLFTHSLMGQWRDLYVLSRHKCVSMFCVFWWRMSFFTSVHRIGPPQLGCIALPSFFVATLIRQFSPYCIQVLPHRLLFLLLALPWSHLSGPGSTAAMLSGFRMWSFGGTAILSVRSVWLLASSPTPRPAAGPLSCSFACKPFPFSCGVPSSS